MEENNVQNVGVGTPQTPVENDPGYQAFMEENISKGKKVYGSVMWKYFIFAIGVNLIQLAASLIWGKKYSDQEWYTWIVTIVSIYMIGFPGLYFLLKKTETMVPEKHSMKFWQFLLVVLMVAGICGVGSIIGILVSLPILAPFGKGVGDANALAEIMTNSTPFMRILVVGILAPIFEELIFRKLFIDHVLKYGEWIAVFLSGLLFGLFHGNFQQAFFATGIGMMFAYIYVRTGKIWYTILFHMVVNLTTSIVTVGIITKLDLEKVTKMSEDMQMHPDTFDITMYQDVLPMFVIYMCWIGFLGLCCMAGVIILIVNLCMKKFYFRSIVGEFPKKIRAKAAMVNPGFFAYLVVIIAMFVLYYVGIIRS